MDWMPLITKAAELYFSTSRVDLYAPDRPLDYRQYQLTCIYYAARTLNVRFVEIALHVNRSNASVQQAFQRIRNEDGSRYHIDANQIIAIAKWKAKEIELEEAISSVDSLIEEVEGLRDKFRHLVGA